MSSPSSARQRRPTAPPHSYSSSPSPSPPTEKTPSLPSRSLIHRAATRALQLCALSLALYIVPAAIQHVVISLSAFYELLGRRARTPFDEVGFARVALGAAVLVVWHAVLITVSYSSARANGGHAKHEVWSRVLSRVLVPAYLVGALGAFGYALVSRIAGPGSVPMDKEAGP